MRRMLVIKLATFFAAATLTCWGQDRGTILGRVTDPSSAVIAGATITVTNQDTGIKTTTNTNEAGNYVVRGLAFGRYEVDCEAKGFRKYVGKDNSVNVAQTLTLDIALQMGAVDQTVEVSARRRWSRAARRISARWSIQKQVADLPLSVNGNVRNPESFVFLAPGVTGDTANTEINGSQDRAKEVLVDGVQSTGPESGGTVGTYPPVEAIGEFKLDGVELQRGVWQDGRRLRDLHDEERHQPVPRVGLRISAQRQVRCPRLHLADHAGQPAERIRRGNSAAR